MKSQKFKRSIIISTLTLATLGLAVAAASAQEDTTPQTRQQRHEARALERINEVLEDIDATEAQRKVVFVELGKLKPELKQLHTTRKTQREEFKQQLLSGKPDAERVHQLINEGSSANLKLAHKALDALVVIHASLNPQQRAQLADQWDLPTREFKGSWFIERGIDRALNQLEATDAQRKLAEQSKAAAFKDINTTLKALDPIKTSALKQWRSEKLDAKALHVSLDKSGVLITQLAHDVADDLVSLAATLSPEQRQKINAHIEKRKARHARHFAQ